MGRYLPRSIRIERKWKHLEEVAQRRGYDSTAAMLQDMYSIQEISIHDLARMLYIPMKTLRSRMLLLGITMRPRGGKHPEVVKSEITPGLVDEVTRDGVPAVAERLGIDPVALQVKLKKWFEDNKGEA